MAELIEKYQENENFAPKQNERDCPLTHMSQGKPDYPVLGQTFYPVSFLKTTVL